MTPRLLPPGPPPPEPTDPIIGVLLMVIAGIGLALAIVYALSP